ncbi:MAG: response regulator transcription factor [Dehalococcoidia bacterium]|nr:response regulator transcription factor [Dehalococcoidia bacterium]
MELPAKKIKVIVADQQPLFRKGVEYFLSQAPDVVICAEASSEPDLVTSVVNEAPDVVLLDISLASDGMELARVVKQLVPSVAVIVISPAPNDEGLFMAIKARAAGYVSRNIAADDLIKIIRRSAAGEYPLNDTFLNQPKVAAQVLEQFQDFSWGKGVESFVSPLTPRETEILNYMAKGYLNKQIASNLDISEQTIKNHVTSILRKLDANARTQAVITAVRRGIISLS